MLPFLAPKKLASVIIATKKADGGLVDQHREDEHNPELIKVADAFIRAVHAKDSEAVADAFIKLFKAAELMPHKEIEHEEYE